MAINKDLIKDELQDFQHSTQDKQLQKLSEMRQELQEVMEEKDNKEDPDNILYTNINRANRFLDILEEQITKEDPDKKTPEKKNTARLFEVSAQLINAITTASSSIAGSYKDDAEYEYKLQVLELKHKELAIKQAIQGGGQKGNTTNNNLIVSSREEILDLIKNQK